MTALSQPLLHDQVQQHAARAASPRATQRPAKGARITGYVMSSLVSPFLAFDALYKVSGLIPANEPNGAVLGFPHHLLFTIGAIELLCLALFLVPRTAVFGALLWTGYLGGAIALHVRVGNPLFCHTLFPIYVALMIWGGLWLRDLRVRALFSLRGPD